MFKFIKTKTSSFIYFFFFFFGWTMQLAGWEGSPKERGYMLYMVDSFTVQQKVTQYCKSTIFQ